MSYLFPFVNLSFLVMSAIRQLLLLECMQLPVAAALYYYHRLITHVCATKSEQNDSRAIKKFVVYKDGFVRRVHEEKDVCEPQEQVYRIVTFYSRQDGVFALMSATSEESTSIIRTLLSPYHACQTKNEILAAECPEIDEDISDIYSMYAGPDGDFHAKFTSEGFDAFAMCDMCGLLIIPPDVRHIKVILRSDLTERDIKLPSVPFYIQNIPPERDDVKQKDTNVHENPREKSAVSADHNPSKPTSSDDFVITDGPDADDESVGGVSR